MAAKMQAKTRSRMSGSSPIRTLGIAQSPLP
jgi:hypothetical protein